MGCIGDLPYGRERVTRTFGDSKDIAEHRPFEEMALFYTISAHLFAFYEARQKVQYLVLQR